MENIVVMQEQIDKKIVDNSAVRLFNLPQEVFLDIFSYFILRDWFNIRRVCLFLNLWSLEKIDWKNIVLINIREVDRLRKVKEIDLFSKLSSSPPVISQINNTNRSLVLKEGTSHQENLSCYKYFKDNYLIVKDIEQKLGINKDKSNITKFVEFIRTGQKPSEEKVYAILEGLKLAAERGYSSVIAKFSGKHFANLATYLREDKNFYYSTFFYYDSNQISKDNILLAATRSGNPACLTLVFSILKKYFATDNTESLSNYIRMAYKYALEKAPAEMIEIYLIFYPALFNYDDVLNFSVSPQNHIFARTILRTVSKKSNPKVIDNTFDQALKNDHETLVIFLLNEYPEQISFFRTFLLAIKHHKEQTLVSLTQHPNSLTLNENEKYRLLVEAIKVKGINKVRLLLGRFKHDLNIPFDNIPLIDIAVIHSSSEVVLQLIVSGANYDLPHLLLCLVETSYTNEKGLVNEKVLREAVQIAEYLIKNNGELVTKGQKSALCEAVKKMNLDFIILFTNYKRKLNMISLDEAKCALGLAKDLAKDMSSPNFWILNRIVLELTSFISAKINHAPHSELFGNKRINKTEDTAVKAVNEPLAPNILKP